MDGKENAICVMNGYMNMVIQKDIFPFVRNVIEKEENSIQERE
jgi:hypothetical protein